MALAKRKRTTAPYVLSLVPSESSGEAGLESETPGERLGEFIRQRRESMGLSQRDASERAQISKSTWQQLESGAGANARNLTLHAVASALEMDPRPLLDLRDDRIGVHDAAAFSRSREEIVESIRRGIELLRTDDVLALEEQVLVRVELRRLQRERSSD